MAMDAADGAGDKVPMSLLCRLGWHRWIKVDFEGTPLGWLCVRCRLPVPVRRYPARWKRER